MQLQSGQGITAFSIPELSFCHHIAQLYPPFCDTRRFFGIDSIIGLFQAVLKKVWIKASMTHAMTCRSCERATMYTLPLSVGDGLWTFL